MVVFNEQKAAEKLKKVASLYLHPFLFSIFPILFLYTVNVSYFPIKVVVRPILLVLYLVFSLFFICKLIFRDANKSAIITTILTLSLFSYGHVYNAFRLVTKPIMGYSCRGYDCELLIVFLWYTLVGLTIFFVIKKAKGFGNINKISTKVSVVLMFVVIVNIIVQNQPWKLNYDTNTNKDFDTNSDFVNLKNKPNVYYIILDGYGRSDVLKDIYDYDNTGFIDGMQKKGFYVGSKSTSNYSSTVLSMASSLNMDYIDKLFDIEEESNNFLPLYDSIYENKVASFFQNQEYEFAVITTGNYYSDIKDADIYIPTAYSLSEFEIGVFNSTPIPVLLSFSRVTRKIFTLDIQRFAVLNAFNELEKIASLNKPVFVFVHIESPHAPFVFGKDGEEVEFLSTVGDAEGPELIYDRGLGKDRYLKMYRNQTKYISKRISDSVEHILSVSQIDPIIIVQGDHGPRSFNDWNNMSDEDYKETMSILNLYYFPDGDYSNLYQNITPVNSFRVIINKLFDTDYELVEDRNYYSTLDLPYAFTNVTDQIK